MNMYDENELIEDTQKDKYLTFGIGVDEFGLEIGYVTEIIKIQDIIEVPDSEKYIKGVINLRGRIIPVMDVRVRVGKPEIDYEDRTCIIVVNIENVDVGLIVDRVSEVLVINTDNIVPPPKVNTIHNRFIKSLGKVENSIKLILDCRELINKDI